MDKELRSGGRGAKIRWARSVDPVGEELRSAGGWRLRSNLRGRGAKIRWARSLDPAGEGVALTGPAAWAHTWGGGRQSKSDHGPTSQGSAGRPGGLAPLS